MDNDNLFEAMISYDRTEYDTLLTITDDCLLFQKKKGLLKKKYKVIETINIADIKVSRNKARLKQKKKRVIIYTINDTFDFDCEDIFVAKNIIEKINEKRMNSRFANEINNKHKVLKISRKAAVSALGIAGITAAIATILKKKTEDVNKSIELLNKTEKKIIRKELK